MAALYSREVALRSPAHVSVGPQMSQVLAGCPWSSFGLLTHPLCAATDAPHSRVHREPPMYLIEDFLAPEVRISLQPTLAARQSSSFAVRPLRAADLLQARPLDQHRLHVCAIRADELPTTCAGV